LTTPLAELDDTTHRTHIEGGVAVVIYTAPWCLPCGALCAAVADSALPRRVAVGTVDVDVHRGLASELDIRSLPTVIVWRNGERAVTHTGAASADDIADAVVKARGAR
jgi:thioredoxin-like negative regulator of GroEL